jgi:aspartate racemase
MLVHAVPQIADRTAAIATGSDEPFRALLAGLRILERSGVELVAMPCNTAHAWFDRLAGSSDVELLHIADAVRRRIGRAPDGRPEAIALMATTGTVRAGFYQRYLTSAPERRMIAPSPAIQSEITAAIEAVKAGDLAAAGESAERAAEALLAAGADRLLLACTELPIALRGTALATRCVDATACLAEACVAFSLDLDGTTDQAPAQLAERGAGTWTSVGSRIS